MCLQVAHAALVLVVMRGLRPGSRLRSVGQVWVTNRKNRTAFVNHVRDNLWFGNAFERVLFFLFAVNEGCECKDRDFVGRDEKHVCVEMLSKVSCFLLRS